MWYAIDMFVLAITGGLGSGKSTAAEYFRSAGARVLDLDEIAVAVTQPGSAVLCKLSDAFGEGIVRPDGSLDRQALAQAAFAGPDEVLRLNATVHPAIADEVKRLIREEERTGDASVLVIEVPLIAEAPEYREIADAVLAISAPEELRVSRAVERGFTESDARRRIALQSTDEERAALADAVVSNCGDLDQFLAQLDGLWHEYLSIASSDR
jgi:dephospho-CoA kinase